MSDPRNTFAAAIDTLLKAEYERGFRDCLTSFCAHAQHLEQQGSEGLGTLVAARRDAPPRKQKRRKLRPSEQQALLAVMASPGLSAMELRAQCGLKSVAPLYALVKRRKIRRVEDPKPWHDGPRVRFYPIGHALETSNGAA